MLLRVFFTALLLLPTVLRAEEVITVRTAAELVANLGPDRIIELKPGTYQLTSVSQMTPTRYAHFEETIDGPELVVFGVQNLTIKGLGKTPPLIIVSPQYANVMQFNDCSDLRIENVRMGHGPEKGHCLGGVLRFEGCQRVAIDNATLFGCGTQGIAFNESTELICTNSIIEECTYHIMSLMGATSVRFEDCIFRNNKEYDMVQIMETTAVTFDRCRFAHNTSEGTSWSTYALFLTRNAHKITLRGCEFENNAFDYFLQGDSEPTIEHTKLEKDNTYRKQSD